MRAFAWFERAYKEQSNILIYLKVFPPYDSLRGRPALSGLGASRRAELTLAPIWKLGSYFR